MKEKIQKFGRSLSSMVMPNIGAFIAWGLITAIFIPGGWWPNPNIAKMVGPMLTYLLPLLIAYTGGKNVGGIRGGVAGAVAAMGVIIGTDTPMFLGAMIMGPLGGWCIAKIDKALKGKVGAGFEMLVDNFSLGIAAMLLSIAGYLLIGHGVAWLTDILSRGVNWMLAHKMNPLLAVLVDPAKVLFLNNAVNHGIMTPLGIQQAAEAGQSMLFLIDPNPGPGLGMLLACWAFGKGTTKQSAPGAVVIQLFGGIHEIYFPYVLARPMLLFPVMIGNICSLLFFSVMDFGLVAPPSPGSIISIILMSPRGKVLIGILGVLIGTAVSFLLSGPIIRRRPDFQGDAEGAPGQTSTSPLPASSVRESTGAGAGGAAPASPLITKVLFACDAGMGSSALGATRFKARLMKAGLPHIKCTNCAVGEIPADASVVVCQRGLASRAASVAASLSTAPYAPSGYPSDAALPEGDAADTNTPPSGSRASAIEVVAIDNFLSDPALDALLLRLQAQTPSPQPQQTPGIPHVPPVANNTPESPSVLPQQTPGTPLVPPVANNTELQLLAEENILVGLPSESKEDAICRAGRQLYTKGYVTESYIDAMIAREAKITTYMGEGLAIPHGTADAKKEVLHSGIVVLQYPDGVDFDGELARLVIGIAGVGDEHLAILSRLASALEDPAVIATLSSTSSTSEILTALTTN